MADTRPYCPFNWLVKQWQWPAATLFAACFLLALAPLMYHFAGLVLTIVYLHLPVYMIHQFEEHTGDRFRKFVNLHIGRGREVLTPLATFWINSLGVWVVDLTAIYLAIFVRPGLGLIAVYMALINGTMHVLQAIALRQYNPGAWTSLVLFLPLGSCCLYLLNAAGATWEDQAIGFGAAAAVHAAIIAHVARRLAHLTGGTSHPMHAAAS